MNVDEWNELFFPCEFWNLFGPNSSTKAKLSLLWPTIKGGKQQQARRPRNKSRCLLKSTVRWRGPLNFSTISAAHLSPIIGFRFPFSQRTESRTAKLQKGAKLTWRRAQAHFEVYEKGWGRGSESIAEAAATFWID